MRSVSDQLTGLSHLLVSVFLQSQLFYETLSKLSAVHASHIRRVTLQKTQKWVELTAFTLDEE